MPRAQAAPPGHPTDRLVGQAPAIHTLRAQIRHLARFDAIGAPSVPTVLLQGETGTGKGLVARIIHDSSPRAHGPFIDVNCAAIPETMLEAELFGYEAGAFTDARRPKPGLVEAAAGGTLFLDEIEALPLLLQSKLLKAIEEKRVRRLGAVAEHTVDVKLVAATQADLNTRVAEGRFRLDLYHRLAVILLTLPPLRERGEDILGLARQFLEQYARGHRLPPRRLSREAEAWLLRYPWPGNVRELSHLMERATLLHPEPVIEASALEGLCLPRPQRDVMRPGAPSTTEAVDEAERIRQALVRAAGNVARAARLLGLSRDTLRYRMRRYGVTAPTLSELARAPLPPSADRPSRPAEGDRAGAVAAPEATPTRPPPRSGGQSPGWERKPVAVLAVEITWPEATILTAEPYEPWTVAARWEEAIVDKAQGFGGVVLQYAPSLLVVAFGLPRTLEQLPQRAVQAAMALRHLTLAESPAASGVARPVMRLALHWGQMLVEDQADKALPQVLAIVETLALPVRLLGQAAPGEVLASAAMGRLVEGWCELQPCAAAGATGFTGRVGAYAIAGGRSEALRPAVRGTRSLSPFVGRGRELATLEELWTQAKGGRGQVVGIVGEPGVGKSRLVLEGLRTCAAHEGRLLQARAASYTQAIPYRPLIDLLKGYFQVEGRDEAETIREKVRRPLSVWDVPPKSTLPTLLTLLDVPAEDQEWQAFEPQRRRQFSMDAIKHVLLRESQRAPLLVMCEDAHWLDGETQAVLDLLVDALPSARLFLLVTYRPEYQHDWGNKSVYTQIKLGPLPPASAEALLLDLLGGDASLPQLKRLLLERTQGNPFFIEESVQTLVETHALVGDQGAYRLPHAPPSLQVPTMVQAVLAARIDRLPPGPRRLLQIAAVIGTEVPVPLLQTIAEEPEDDLPRSLAGLQAAEFLYETQRVPGQAYTFKHALTHEVAYDSLPPGQRRTLHARIVTTLEGLAGERLVEQVEPLAHHALRAEVWDKALTYCRQAGEKALARSAHREAVAYFEQALSALSHLPETRETLEQAIDLRLALRSGLNVDNMSTSDFDRTLVYLREAEALAEALDNPRRLAEVSNFLSRHYSFLGAHDQAIVAAQRALALAPAGGDVAQRARAIQRIGMIALWQGNYRQTIDYMRQTVALLDGAQ